MKYYLIAILLIIMAAGARTMFEIAHHGMAREHDFGPDEETGTLMILAVWFILMMVVDVLLISYKQLPKRNLLIVLLTIGVLAPAIYQFLHH